MAMIEFEESTIGKVTIGVKWINKPGAFNFYGARGSVLGNPYPITEAEDRDTVCDKYEVYIKERLDRQDQELIEVLNMLLVKLANGTNVNLQCYCGANKRCHLETIKRLLEEKLDESV